METNHEDLIRRATAALFRSDSAPVQPAAGRSTVETAGTLTYVVLRNVDGIVAVYRVRYDGVLRRMKRWPASIA